MAVRAVGEVDRKANAKERTLGKTNVFYVTLVGEAQWWDVFGVHLPFADNSSPQLWVLLQALLQRWGPGRKRTWTCS